MNKNGKAGVLFYQRNADFEKFFDEIKDIGLDYVVTVKNVVENTNFCETAQKHKIPFYIDFPVFYNRDFLQKKPEYYAITDKGHHATESWSHFVCPSRNDYFDMKLQELADIVRNFSPSGIYLDFIRFFAFWEFIFENTNINSIPDTCYCPKCLNSFMDYSGINLPSEKTDILEISGYIRNTHINEWTDWKTSLISEKVKKIRNTIKRINKDIFLASHVIPWKKDDFNGALENVVGQSVEKMSEHLDYISPMLYSPMLGRTTIWTESVLKEFSERKSANCGLIATIQGNKCYDEPDVSKEEFEKTVKTALNVPSDGFMIFNWKGIENDTQKKVILKNILNSN